MTQPPVVSPGGPPPSGFAAVAQAMADGTDDASWVDEYVDHVVGRDDLADHRAMVLLALRLDGEDLLPEGLRIAIDDALLGFRYWMDEPGCDSMCHWSESHQVAFAVCEYLAGMHLVERTFTNDGRVGLEKARRARARLLEWLGNRFRHGFSEWLSPAYYAVNVSALTLLVEHTGDDELRTRATMVLDLLMLDLALHRFDGHFVASSGRSEALHKAHPERSEIEPIVASAFSRNQPDLRPGDFTSIFVARQRYRIPQVVREIAFAQADHLVTTSQGLTVREVPHEVARMQPDGRLRRAAEVNLYWGMEAFTTPEAIGPTLEAIEQLGMDGNRFLAPLAPMRKVRGRRLQAALVRSLNPITQGAALHRADVQTYRTPHYLLSSAQRHHPGSFGDQENIWEAALPGDIRLFSTHPGSTLLGSSARPATPSGWVGNGIRPDVAQLRNVLLALHDLRGRRGYLEGRRHELSHLYFPAARFDETRLTGKVMAGRRDDSYFGVVALQTIEMINESELVQRGAVTGWAVMLADRSDFGSLHHFVEHLRSCRLTYARDTLDWFTPEHRYELTWRGPFLVDGVPVDTDYARLRCEWTTVPRKPSVIEVVGRTGTLFLDWRTGQRTQGPGRPSNG